VWAAFNADGNVAANGQTLLGVGNAALLALRPFTIVRTRGVIQYQTDQITATEITSGVVAAIVVQEEAVDAGIASLPTPITEPEALYFLYEPVIDSMLFVSASGFRDPAGHVKEFDSKAMRKVSLTEDIAVIVEENGGFGAGITIVGRMLLKLH
jgi:hypothetical protein